MVYDICCSARQKSEGAGNTKCFSESAVRITRKQEGQGVFFSKAFMALLCIATCADNYSIEGGEVWVGISEGTGLACTYRCIIFWVKEEHYRLFLFKIRKFCGYQLTNVSRISIRILAANLSI